MLPSCLPYGIDTAAVDLSSSLRLCCPEICHAGTTGARLREGEERLSGGVVDAKCDSLLVEDVILKACLGIKYRSIQQSITMLFSLSAKEWERLKLVEERKMVFGIDASQTHQQKKINHDSAGCPKTRLLF